MKNLFMLLSICASSYASQPLYHSEKKSKSSAETFINYDMLGTKEWRWITGVKMKNKIKGIVAGDKGICTFLCNGAHKISYGTLDESIQAKKVILSPKATHSAALDQEGYITLYDHGLNTSHVFDDKAYSNIIAFLMREQRSYLLAIIHAGNMVGIDVDTKEEVDLNLEKNWNKSFNNLLIETTSLPLEQHQFIHTGNTLEFNGTEILAGKTMEAQEKNALLVKKIKKWYKF